MGCRASVQPLPLVQIDDDPGTRWGTVIHIAMVHGDSRPMENVAVGSDVLDRRGDNRLSTFNDGSYFVIAEQLFLIKNGRKAVGTSLSSCFRRCLCIRPGLKEGKVSKMVRDRIHATAVGV